MKTLLQSFVCARVTDMAHVNLERFRFDYDLTFAMTAHYADGRSLSRFGARDEKGPEVWLSDKSIEMWLRRCLDVHQSWRKTEKSIKAVPERPGQTIMDVKAFTSRLRGKKVECVHCHSVGPALRRQAIDNKTWNTGNKYVSPSPLRAGIELDPVDQTRVKSVRQGSAAAKAGLRPGDEVQRAGSRRILSISDFQLALHDADPGLAKLKLEWARQGKAMAADLHLPAGWKVCSPWEYAWRPMKWELVPAPGFGGQLLGSKRRKSAGIPEGAFAMRVDYLVDWGPRARLGRNARKAGLKKGDILLAVDGKNDFKSADHFHSWVRLMCRPGQKLKLTILRGSQKSVLSLTLMDA